MRHTLFLSSFFLSACFVQAQQITNVTIAPSPLHACERATYHVMGTGAPGLSFTFVQTSNTANSVTLVATVSAGNGSSSFNQPIGPIGPYNEGTYALTVSLKFGTVITDTWTGNFTVLPADPPNVGNYTEIAVCPNDAPFPLLSRLGGSPDPGGLWLNPVLQPVPNGMFVPGTSIAGDYQYYFDIPAPCIAEYQSLYITYNPNTSAGVNASVTLCTAPGAPPVNLFTQLGGTPNPGGTWTGPNTTGIFIPGTSQPGQYVYHVTGTPPCSNPSATVTVVGAPPSNPGVGSPAVFCFDETAANLSNYVTGEDITGIWYEPNGAGITFFDQPVDVSTFGAGVYRYVVETPPCPADTAYVAVTLNGPPCTLGISGGSSTGDLMRLAPNPATDKVVVVIERMHPGKEQFIELSDVNGKIVLRRALNGTGTSVREVLDLTPLAPGAYTVKLVGSKSVPTQRLMVR
ncbi:MAG: T9SS type A sorting domain-containing protein [Flavobacteriales bacterium]|nr:T9SS type A sorting domain-containing protein [Flavobacteriales bacterium]MBK7246244.1 T9SS type A sorting domain-containing protein [Flavobacteriales bacterium]QQS71938.1 MAG: T9SS type A sorting domain-containing protein [Flavobacteriales bacterium]HQV37724.1 T9SS type A sorting domain-containing protein [Flavobacteriales bacterium]HQW30860.1 T9SS type A sorting domain-containing protein [Flavobacteriales bacterium]